MHSLYKFGSKGGSHLRVLFLESHPLFIHGLPNGFRDAGHTVKISGPITESNIPILIAKFRPHLIITLGCGPEHFLEKQAWIRAGVENSGIPHIYWATEDPTHSYTFTIPYIQNVKPDFVFTICRDRVVEYENMGYPSAHLDFGYHRRVHHRGKRAHKYLHSIAVVANAYPKLSDTYPEHYRHTSFNTLLRPVIDSGQSVHFYGRYWDQMQDILGREISPRRIHGYLSYPRAYKVYNSSRIIIGLQNHRTQVTQRTYEIIASGGLLLTSDTPAIRHRFVPGQDLLVSSSPEETLSLIQYYLNNRDARKRIQQSGYQAVKKHSYWHRARQLLYVLRHRGII